MVGSEQVGVNTEQGGGGGTDKFVSACENCRWEWEVEYEREQEWSGSENDSNGEKKYSKEACRVVDKI